MNGKRRILTRGMKVELAVRIPWPQFRVITVGKKVISPGSAGERGKTMGDEKTAELAAEVVKLWTAMQEVLKELALDAVFP